MAKTTKPTRTVNKNAKAVPLALDRYGDFIRADSRGRDVISGARFALDRPLTLAARAATIIEIE